MPGSCSEQVGRALPAACRAQASVNGRKLRSVPVPHGFGQLRIEATSPYNASLSRYIAFPALFRLSLKPL